MKKILYLINVDWFFVSHFLPVAQKALENGYEVHLTCKFTDKEEYLQSLGFYTYPLSLSRSSTTLTQELRVMGEMYRVLSEVQPDIAEFLTIKPVLYGGIVSHFCSLEKKIFYITGLGYIFTRKDFRGRIVKTFVKLLYRLALFGSKSYVITENSFDKKLIESLGVVPQERIHIIKGAGVDLNEYVYKEEPHKKPLEVVMASRLLKDKGVLEFVAAAKHLQEEGCQAHFILYGDRDIYNPTSLSEEELVKIQEEGYVEVRGFCSDIAKAFCEANLVVLPSYREGLPKVLIEAAAAGRAVVTTDVVGCRDAIEIGKTGLVCNVKDVVDLAHTIKKLLQDDNLRHKFARQSHLLAQKEYDICKITAQHLQLYRDEK